MRRLVLDLGDARPLLRMPDWMPERVRAALGDGWQVVEVDAPASGLADGATSASPEALEAVRDAEVYMGFGVPSDVVRAGERLRWAHTGTAGVNTSLTAALRESGIVFTNSAGVHGPAIAESVLGMILYFARGLDVAAAAQRERSWDKTRFDAADTVAREVAGATVGIIGYGGIGREVGRRVAGLGGMVVGVRRGGSGSRLEARGSRGEGSGLREAVGVRVVQGGEGLDVALRESDYLVLAAPETEETRGVIDGAALARMKEGAVLINVARGALVVEEALVEALRDGRLRGAGLDVFRQEPLPADHPLWGMPNVLITPHVSSYTSRFWERECALIEENARRYVRREPLRNVVEWERGY